jgi:hypothetical protein
LGFCGDDHEYSAFASCVLREVLKDAIAVNPTSEADGSAGVVPGVLI